MSKAVRSLTPTGYSLLVDLAGENPGLFAEPDDLKQEVDNRIKQNADEESRVFMEHVWQPKESLDQLIDNAVKGPELDFEHAIELRRIFPEFTAFEMSNPDVLASINCFHIPDYVRTRWGTSSLAKSAEQRKQTNFVKSHYLGSSKESNTVARLWWLYEFARRASDHSQYSFEILLKKMAGNVNFYHQMLRRSYLMASDRIRAAILDVAIASGLADENKTGSVNKVMQSLNRKAGGISFDILSYKELRRHVEESLPPKEVAAPSPRP